ncbi:MAG: carbohydrate binding domain-containing protein [Bacteroidaceae bacterium]|nr:carbohydrate binding domain-containing protein [Bacteroidaceae bacterium]
MKHLKKTFFAAALLLAACNPADEHQVVINVDATQKGPEVSPMLYGIFYEDINHAADGGLYAELIRNRSFEDDNAIPGAEKRADKGGSAQEKTRPGNWFAVGGAALRLVRQNLLNDVQHNALGVTTAKAGDGVRNEGFWGMNVVEGTAYRLSFWAKSDRGFKGALSASLLTAGGKDLGHSQIDVELGRTWQKYTAVISATGTDPKAEFALTADKAGEFQLDVVSLFPPTFKDRENGMRPDLAQMLADMHPRFMRFPGGCFVEGSLSPDNAFRWKRTIGPIEQREGHANVNWGYRTSDGIGFHEYLQLAEDIGAKPLFVVNVGIWHGGCTPYDQIDGWIQECLDALEYANGDASTTYGKLRAENGHPEPFGLEYIEIGNENYNYHMDNNSDQSDHYPERYRQFYDAIKAKYPNVHCIGNVESWGTDDPSWKNDNPVEIVDEHYYRDPKWFADRFGKYDSYDRSKNKVYVGEYAVTNRFGVIGNLNAALGEAVFMMGMENNSDVVVMNSYAPIFVNENDARWRPDMIRFNSSQVMGTPSYYVQQLFPNNVGTQVLKTEWTYSLSMPEELAEKEASPVQVGVATWNTNATFRNAELLVDGSPVSIDDYSAWDKQNGQWTASGDEISQGGNEQPAMSLCPQKISAKNYTFKVQARKNAGAEGFLIVFGYKDGQDYLWYNIGGWGNKRNNVEQALGGGKFSLAADKPFAVEADRWYDIQIDVDGENVKCFIDGQQDFECKVQKNNGMEGVYASTTIDEAAKMMFVKVVNVGEGYAGGILNLKNCSVNTAEKDAVSLIRLSSASGEDENTLDDPTRICPTMGEAKATSGNRVTFNVPAYSVNILRIRLK